jgi:hypothetical protein
LYVASQHQYKYGHYEQFALSQKPLWPSGAKIQKFEYPDKALRDCPEMKSSNVGLFQIYMYILLHH